MADIFDAKVSCRNCNKEMGRRVISRNGFSMREWVCNGCGEKILHPGDKACFENYKNLKGKDYEVKLRIVGNSHAVSIPKEIVEFMKDMSEQMHKEMDDMVRMSLDDFGSVVLRFGNFGGRR